MESLGVAAAERPQGVDLDAVLDALGDRLHPEMMRELEDRLRERRLVRMPSQLGDERAMHLEDLDRVPLEVAERRVAGAEVVDRQPDSELTELLAGA